MEEEKPQFADNPSTEVRPEVKAKLGEMLGVASFTTHKFSLNMFSKGGKDTPSSNSAFGAADGTRAGQSGEQEEKKSNSRLIGLIVFAVVLLGGNYLWEQSENAPANAVRASNGMLLENAGGASQEEIDRAAAQIQQSLDKFNRTGQGLRTGSPKPVDPKVGPKKKRKRKKLRKKPIKKQSK